MSNSPYINQTTQDLELTSAGNILEQNSLLTEIYARLSCPIGTYRYDSNFGSTLPNIIQNRQKITINQLQTAIVNSLLPILNRGDLLNVDFVLITLGIGSFSIQLTVTDSQSNIFTFPYSVAG
jgi:phage baseplate assembly protein W